MHIDLAMSQLAIASVFLCLMASLLLAVSRSRQRSLEPSHRRNLIAVGHA